MNVLIDESCDECGGALMLQTEAKQPAEGWTAYDGDEAFCTECGIVHSLHHDGDGGSGWFSS